MLIGALVFVMGCSDREEKVVADTMAKVEIDLNALDHEGLRGPADGKVAVSYEFAIPNTEECKIAVRKIDPSVEFMPGSKGRVGAGDGKCLCIGSTHKQSYRVVLRSLSELPFVDRIMECHFE